MFHTSICHYVRTGRIDRYPPDGFFGFFFFSFFCSIKMENIWVGVVITVITMPTRRMHPFCCSEWVWRLAQCLYCWVRMWYERWRRQGQQQQWCCWWCGGGEYSAKARRKKVAERGIHTTLEICLVYAVSGGHKNWKFKQNCRFFRQTYIPLYVSEGCSIFPIYHFSSFVFKNLF